jgi:phosphatidylserine/phosphatidylglycerophosphate/cardiolipin synthase-like enzyme
VSFVAPLDPAVWTFATGAPVVVPPGLRDAGRTLLALRATASAPSPVLAPATGIARRVGSGGRTVVEVLINPFVETGVVRRLPFGAPALLFVVESGAVVVPIDDGDTVVAGDLLATTDAVTVLCAGQDRIARDPALWARLVADAGAGDGWDAFADAVDAAVLGAEPPVLLLDHTGAPVSDHDVVITAGGTTVTATMIGDDGGDLQRTVARLHAADPSSMPLTGVFGGASSTTIAPASPDAQLAAVDDGGATTAEAVVAVTPQRRHLMVTDLETWFAPQFAVPVGATPLPRYSRGSRFTPFVNGKPYFDDLMRELREAATAARAGDGGGLHLVGGWKTFPEAELTDPGPPPEAGELAIPTTLLEAATLLDQHGGACRFLSPQFFQLDQGSVTETAEIVLVFTLAGGLMAAADIDVVRSDGTGVVVLLAIAAANAIAVTWIISTDGAALEPNADMLDVFASLPSVESRFGPHPATIADNPAATNLSGWPFDTLLQVDSRFGFYHQKFGVVAVGDRRVAYCGGIDINPNRLDDHRHLEPGPYHDVHARIDGPAARDVEVSFQQRWSRDGGGTPLAFRPDGVYPADGPDVVQVARTYFRPADPSRRLDYAPGGDKTILQTMVRAIESAREFIYIEDQYFTPPDEYRLALLDKVESGDIGALVIVLPSSPDQPFGETQRYGLVEELRVADAGRRIVQVGTMRRHYTLAENEVRASSGRLVLVDGLPASESLTSTIALGPPSRIPAPPFWVAVEGELVYVYDESTAINDAPDRKRILSALRGGDTRLLRGGPVTPASGTRVREHDPGAAVTVVNFNGIYVHSKMMIVDDVFVGIGSANLNRRGLCHDGELTAFSVPESLRASPENPVAALRRTLWAEMLDLPASTADALLADPITAAGLFRRSPLLGNRFVDVDAVPTKLMWNATGGDGLVLDLLRLLLLDPFVIVDHEAVFDAIVDPTSAVETA